MPPLDDKDPHWTAGFRMSTEEREARKAEAERKRREARDAETRAMSQPRSMGAQVVGALFGDRPPTLESRVGDVDYAEIDRRPKETEADISRTLDAAAASGYPELAYGAWPAAALQWVNRVRPHGIWDDKQDGRLVPDERDPSQKRNTLEGQGNYSYGATAHALGLSKDIALRGAGLAQRASNLINALNGKKLSPSMGALNKPYGDDPNDQIPIPLGWDRDRRRRP